MFRSLLQALKRKNLMAEALDITEEGMVKAEKITRASLALLLDRQQPKFDIYALDREINRDEIMVRRLIFQHQLLNPDMELTPSLVITSTIIDVERIGDYAKNIYELAEKYPHPFEGSEHFDAVREIATETLSMFGETATAFREADVPRAERIMREHSDVGRRCESIIDKVVEDPDLKAKDAVAIVLAARYLKRVSAHLSNLASSVVNPFDRIGFKPGKDGPEDAD